MFAVVASAAGCADDCYDDPLVAANDPRCRDSEDFSHEDPNRPGRLLAVDLATGSVTPIRDEIFGSGANLQLPVAIELSPDGAFAYIADGAAILRIRIEDGETKVVSDAATGSGIDFLDPAGLEWETDTERLLVHDRGLDAVIAVDPSSGNRTGTLLPYSPRSTEEERRIRDDARGVEYIVFKRT